MAFQRQRDALARIGGRDHAQVGQEADDVFHQPQAGRIVFHVQQQGLAARIVAGVVARLGQRVRFRQQAGRQRGHGVEFDPEHAAYADAAVHAHAAAHQLDEALGDDQADARAFLAARLLAQPVKRLEQFGHLRVVQALARVADGDAHALRSGLRDFQLHLAGRAVVLDGVRQQVQQHLLEARMVGPHRQLLARRKDHVDLALLRLLLHHHAHFLDQRGQRHRLDRQAQAARFDLRQVEDFIDQRQKMAARSDDVLHEGALLHDSRGQRFVGQQLGKAEDGVERRAQFVRHAGEKAVLGLAGPLQFDFLFVERAFDALALRDVADGRRHQHAFLRFQRRQADFDGKLGAVAAQAVQFQARAHGAGARRRGKGLPVLRMVSRVAGRDQHFHIASQQLRARIAEQAFRLRVDEHDLAIAIDDDDGVRRRFEQAAELLLGPAPVADVADGADDEGADLRLDGREADFDGELDVVLA